MANRVALETGLKVSQMTPDARAVVADLRLDADNNGIIDQRDATQIEQALASSEENPRQQQALRSIQTLAAQALKLSPPKRSGSTLPALNQVFGDVDHPKTGDLESKTIVALTDSAKTALAKTSLEERLHMLTSISDDTKLGIKLGITQGGFFTLDRAAAIKAILETTPAAQAPALAQAMDATLVHAKPFVDYLQRELKGSDSRASLDQFLNRNLFERRDHGLQERFARIVTLLSRPELNPAHRKELISLVRHADDHRGALVRALFQEGQLRSLLHKSDEQDALRPLLIAEAEKLEPTLAVDIFADIGGFDGPSFEALASGLNTAQKAALARDLPLMKRLVAQANSSAKTQVRSVLYGLISTYTSPAEALVAFAELGNFSASALEVVLLQIPPNQVAPLAAQNELLSKLMAGAKPAEKPEVRALLSSFILRLDQAEQVAPAMLALGLDSLDDAIQALQQIRSKTPGLVEGVAQRWFGVGGSLRSMLTFITWMPSENMTEFAVQALEPKVLDGIFQNHTRAWKKLSTALPDGPTRAELAEEFNLHHDRDRVMRSFERRFVEHVDAQLKATIARDLGISEQRIVLTQPQDWLHAQSPELWSKLTSSARSGGKITLPELNDALIGHRDVWFDYESATLWRALREIPMSDRAKLQAFKQASAAPASVDLPMKAELRKAHRDLFAQAIDEEELRSIILRHAYQEEGLGGFLSEEERYALKEALERSWFAEDFLGQPSTAKLLAIQMAGGASPASVGIVPQSERTPRPGERTGRPS